MILIIGAPRSGTTWLAKIFDSHPDVVYRHEPDEFIHPPAELNNNTVVPLLRAWAGTRRLRAVSKPPYFFKSWQSKAGWLLRSSLAFGLRAASASPLLRDAIQRLRLPDFADTRNARVVMKTVRWCDGVGIAAGAMPSLRVILIIRHPPGQIWSVMRGNREARFDLRGGADMPLDEASAMACAHRFGVTQAAFHALPEAAQYAWGWVAFNEAMTSCLDGLPNVKIVRYEDLCEAPASIARDAMAFAGLNWHPQTAAFVHRSTTYSGNSGYYDILKDTKRATSRWRTEMAEHDQRIIRDIARLSPIARYWPDLAQPALPHDDPCDPPAAAPLGRQSALDGVGRSATSVHRG